MSEGMTPEQLISFLNQYLSKMTQIILESNGVIDKYIGDAVMAFWGAPLRNEKHAINGVLAALKMIDVLLEFNEQSKQTGRPIIDIGIGLNTGNATVGNMGSEKRFDYTVLGDNVNLASRLEGLTKVYGVNIIVAQSTIAAIPDEENILTRELDRVRVKGKKKPVTIYEIIPRARYENVQSILGDFKEGRECYYNGEWNRAISAFMKVLEKAPDDGPTKTLKNRCEGFLHRPADNWEGIFEMTSK
jgi:adenylate cyclase